MILNLYFIYILHLCTSFILFNKAIISVLVSDRHFHVSSISNFILPCETVSGYNSTPGLFPYSNLCGDLKRKYCLIWYVVKSSWRCHVMTSKVHDNEQFNNVNGHQYQCLNHCVLIKISFWSRCDKAMRLLLHRTYSRSENSKLLK